MPADGTLFADEQFFNLMRSDCEIEAKTLSAQPRVMMDALRDYYDSGSVILTDVNSAMEDFERAGGLDFSVVLASPSQESLANHITRLRKLKEELENLNFVEANSEMQFRDALIKGGVAQPALDHALEVFRHHIIPDARVEHRDADVNFITNGIAAMILLHDNFGTWELTDRPSLRFEDEGLTVQWGELMNNLVQAKGQSERAAQRRR